jgi:hypothetical protein
LWATQQTPPLEQQALSSNLAAATGPMQLACHLHSTLQWVLLWCQQVLQQQQQQPVLLWVAVLQCHLQLWVVCRLLFCRRAASATRPSRRASAALMALHILQDQQQQQQQQLEQQLLQVITLRTRSRCRWQLALLLE